MSTPYFIHKDDADVYDLVQKEFTSFREEFRKREDILYDSLKGEELRNALNIVFKESKEKYDAVLAKHNRTEIKSKSIFFSESINPNEYYTYFKGFRLEGKFAEDMVNIAENGMAGIQKAMGLPEKKGNS